MLYDSNQIQQIIPHRYPFLLVDAIESINEEGTAIVGTQMRNSKRNAVSGTFSAKHLMPAY